MNSNLKKRCFSLLGAIGVLLLSQHFAAAYGVVDCNIWTPWRFIQSPTVTLYIINQPAGPIACCDTFSVSVGFDVEGSYEITRQNACGTVQTVEIPYYFTNFEYSAYGAVAMDQLPSGSGGGWPVTFIAQQNGSVEFTVQVAPEFSALQQEGVLTGSYPDYLNFINTNNLAVPGYAYVGFTTYQPLTCLGFWQFSDSSWIGEEGQIPSVATGLQYVTNWNDGAVAMNASSSVLGYPAAGFCLPNISRNTGSIRFWYSPNWSSGTGPGNLAKLIEMSPNSNWYLCVDSTGNNIMMVSKGDSDSQYVTNLVRSINWVAGQWYQIVATYSSSFNDVAVYVNGARLGDHSYVPVDGATVTSFTIGNGADGGSPSFGVFDELQTFNYVLNPNQIQYDYQQVIQELASGTYGNGNPPPNPDDHTPPTIQLLQPANATPVP